MKIPALLLLLTLGLAALAASCGSESDRQYYPAGEMQPAEATALEVLNNDECAVHPERCIDWSATSAAEQSDPLGAYRGNSVAPLGGCPNGCTSHALGCDIKGNISFETKEKIYHLPGDEYYSQTVINPAYGERWFCTEPEAIANGWRRTQAR